MMHGRHLWSTSMSSSSHTPTISYHASPTKTIEKQKKRRRAPISKLIAKMPSFGNAILRFRKHPIYGKVTRQASHKPPGELLPLRFCRGYCIRDPYCTDGNSIPGRPRYHSSGSGYERRKSIDLWPLALGMTFVGRVKGEGAPRETAFWLIATSRNRISKMRVVCALSSFLRNVPSTSGSKSRPLYVAASTTLRRYERGTSDPARGKEKRTLRPRGLKKKIRTPPVEMETLSQHFACSADDTLADQLEAPTFVYSQVEPREPTAEG